MRSFFALLLLCFLFYSGAAQVGNLDPAFGGTGLVQSSVNGTIYKSIVVQTDGKIIAGGAKELVRYNANGTLDASFGTGGKQTTGIYAIGAIALQNDGKIIVGTSRDFILMRYTTNGRLDSTFGTDGISSTDFDYDPYDFEAFDPFVTSIAVQPDGKIIAVGSADVFEVDPFGNSDPFLIGRSFALARYTADGILDRTFNGDGRYKATEAYGSFVYLNISSLVLQPDRKIVIAGSKDGDFYVSRFRTDGRPDSSFGTSGVQTTDFGAEDSAYAVALQTDGKIIAAGTSNNDFATARYLSNGSPDPAFDGDGRKITGLSSSSNDTIYAVTVQPDGKIVAAGNNGARFALVRYSATGALDAAFSGDGKQTNDVGTGIDNIYSIAISGNTLYVCGYTTFSQNGSLNTKGVVGAYALGTLPSTASAKATKVNIYGGSNPYVNSEWNNWNVSSSLNSGTLKFANAAASTVTAALNSSSGVIDNGSSYGGYMAPPSVLRYTSAGSATRTLTLSGLSTTKKYSLELYTSRAHADVNTRFTINSNAVAIQSSFNKTDKASFINLVPTASGQIVVSISSVNSSNYLNGFILTEQSGSCPGTETTPLYPLRGQLCSGTAITLTASGGTSYQWYRADGSPIAGQTGPTYPATEPGVYTVRAFNGGCASGLSEDAAIEGTLAYPGQPPAQIGNARSGFYCIPANIGINTVIGQQYTWLQNGKKARGPVDGSGSPISYGFSSAGAARIASSALKTAAGATTLAESQYTIPPTYYNVITTKPGCSDTVSSKIITVYHSMPVEGLIINSLGGTSVTFSWKPLIPDTVAVLTYHYEVYEDTPGSTHQEDFIEGESGLSASVGSLVPGRKYIIRITAFEQDSPDGCSTDPTTLQFTTPVLSVTTFLPTSGAVGVGVMIKGTDFNNVSAIRFNGVAATEIYAASSTLLYAKVPSGATTGPIQVETSNGVATSSSNFTVASISSKWVSKTGLTTARLQHGTIATGGKIYVFGGRNSASLLSSLEIYTPGTNTWSAGASMPVAIRGMASALGSDGNIYMFGGASSANTVSSAYKYTPSSNTWTTIAPAPEAVFEAAAATVGGKIYLFGGEPVSAKNTSTNATRIYDVATNTWSSGANMPVGVQQHSAITGADNKIYVIGGRAFSANEPLGLVQVYNPGTNTWSTGAPMLIPKVQFGAIKAGDGRIFVIGGKASEPNNTGPFFHTVEIYTPSTNSWASGQVLPKQFGQQTAAKLNDDLYAIGGSDGTYRNYNYQLVVTPAAPSSLAATASSSSQINLSWKDNSLNETGFTVERGTTSSGPFSTIATVGTNVKTYSNTGLTASTKYYYRVKATNAAGSSPYSAVASATTLGGTTSLVAGNGEIGSTEEKDLVSNNLSVHPNPAKGGTRIGFTVNKEQRLQLGIYDERGNLVTLLYNGVAEAGKAYQVYWNAGRTTPGMYFGRLLTVDGTLTEKIVLLPK